MRPVVTVFAKSPDGGVGLARDMPVRWALEETGREYDVRPVSFREMKGHAHRARHPFGQIPVYEEGGLVLFESGAIVLRVAEARPGLLSTEAGARARAVMWMFAATCTVEPPIVEREAAGHREGREPWHARRLPQMEARIRGRLGELSARLGDAAWLDGGFSAGDLMMISVLRRLAGSDLLAGDRRLAAYVARGEARPAFRRAFDAQRATFEAG